MVKSISIEELEQGALSKALRQAEREPVLIRKADKPAAWLISAERLAAAAAALGDASRDAYQQALRLLAVELYDKDTITLGTGARLCGMNIHDFIDLCAALDVPILRQTPEEVEADLKGLEALLGRGQHATDR